MSANVLDQAQNVQGVVSAARKRDSWSRQEANATDDSKRRMYREAIFDLEQRFPDLGDVPVGGAEAFARQRGHGKSSRSPVHSGRSRTRPGTTRRASTPSTKPSSGSPRDKTPRSRRDASSAPRRATSAATPRVNRAIGQTGIPQAVESGGSVVMATLGATVGLSLFYLVVSSAEKKGTPMKAFPSLVEGITKAVGRFIEPVDVFPSNGTSHAAADAAGAKVAARTPVRLPAHPRGAHSFNNR